MRLRILTNIGTRDCSVRPLLMSGEERDVTNAIGRALVARGFAVDITPPEPKVLKAIPDKPAIAEAAKPEIGAATKRHQPKKKKPVINVTQNKET